VKTIDPSGLTARPPSASAAKVLRTAKRAAHSFVPPPSVVVPRSVVARPGGRVYPGMCGSLVTASAEVRSNPCGLVA